MANLRNFVWSGLKDGSPLDFYKAGVLIGKGKVNTLEPLHLNVTGKLAGIIEGTVDIKMPDESPRGRCTVMGPGDEKPVEADYHTEGGRLKIAYKAGIALYDHDRMYSWIGYGILGWYGAWPEGKEVSAGVAPHEQ